MDSMKEGGAIGFQKHQVRAMVPETRHPGMGAAFLYWWLMPVGFAAKDHAPEFVLSAEWPAA